MSEFTTPLRGRWTYNKKGKEAYHLEEPFKYYVGHLGSKDFIEVFVGFETDFASVPRLFWGVIPPYGVHGKAAVIHDFLYYKKNRPRKECDKIFLEAMLVSGVKEWKAKVMYRAVRVFGAIVWKFKAV